MGEKHVDPLVILTHTHLSNPVHHLPTQLQPTVPHNQLTGACDLPAAQSNYQDTQGLKPLIQPFMFTFLSKNRIEDPARLQIKAD